MMSRRQILLSSVAAAAFAGAAGAPRSGALAAFQLGGDEHLREAQFEAGPKDGSIALALGGGAAKGLAHIPVLEAFDEMGIRPRVLAGTSMGALIGACYASGMSGGEIRLYATDLFKSRIEVLRRIFGGPATSWFQLLAFTEAAVLEPEALFGAALPDTLPGRFEDLLTPFKAIATDFHDQEQVILDRGPLLPAISASSALPVLLKPVEHGGRVLIDGGFVNPTPFDILIGSAQFTVAVDVTGKQASPDRAVPGPLDAWIGAWHIVHRSLVDAKLRHVQPDILVRPDISAFNSMDFYEIDEILAAAEPAKDLIKRRVDALLADQ
jgi:NTE family protein